MAYFSKQSTTGVSSWYKQYLGLDVLEWGGAIFPWQKLPDLNSAGYSLWVPFEEKTDYFAPSSQTFMVNFVVDDLEGLVKNLQSQNQAISETQSQEQGKFAWIIHPEGNKVELWEPTW